eukprot:803044-Pelagomonas_calceolata.AAC.6
MVQTSTVQHRTCSQASCHRGAGNYVGSRSTPFINEGTGDTRAERAVSPLQQKIMLKRDRWPSRPARTCISFRVVCSGWRNLQGSVVRACLAPGKLTTARGGDLVHKAVELGQQKLQPRQTFLQD